jgi:hypothetical protein
VALTGPPSVAVHTVTVTCNDCGQPIQCPVILTAGQPVRSPVDGRLIVPVATKVDSGPVLEHECPADPDPVPYIPRQRAAEDLAALRAA